MLLRQLDSAAALTRSASGLLGLSRDCACAPEESLRRAPSLGFWEILNRFLYVSAWPLLSRIIVVVVLLLLARSVPSGLRCAVHCLVRTWQESLLCTYYVKSVKCQFDWNWLLELIIFFIIVIIRAGLDSLLEFSWSNLLLLIRKSSQFNLVL